MSAPPDGALNDLKRAIEYLPAEEQANLQKYFHRSHENWFPQGLQKQIEQNNSLIQQCVSYLPAEVCPPNRERDVFAGEFPTDSFNALVRRCSSGYLILVNRGLMLLLFRLARAISTRICFEEGVGNPTIDYECESELDEVSNYVRKAIRSTLDGQLVPECPALLSWNRIILSAMIAYYAQMFALWHEWSHILLGHLDQARERTVQMFGLKVPIVCPEAEDESQADECAANLLIAFLFGKPPKIDANDPYYLSSIKAAAVAPIFTCRILSMLEKVSNKTPQNHPPGVVRADTIRHSLKSILPEEVFNLDSSIDFFMRGLIFDL